MFLFFFLAAICRELVSHLSDRGSGLEGLIVMGVNGAVDSRVLEGVELFMYFAVSRTGSEKNTSQFHVFELGGFSEIF